MKLSFSTLGCPAWSLAAVIDAAGRLGYDGVELRFLEGDDALWARPELTGAGLRESHRPAARRRARDLLRRHALVLPSSGRGGRASAAIDEAARSIELAARLGAPGIRVFGDRIQPGQDRETTRGWIAEALARLGEAARPHGRRGLDRVARRFRAGARTRSASCPRTASRRRVGVLWDPANAFEAGEEPADGLAVLGDRVRHVHLKDVARQATEDGRRGWVPRLPGQGEFASGARPGRAARARLRPLGLLRVGEALASRARGAGGGAAALRALGRAARCASRRTGGARRRRALLSRGRLEVEVHPDRPAMGRGRGGGRVARTCGARSHRDGRAAAIFASAPSQNEFLAALREDTSIPWDRVTAFHLDEYIGVGRHASRLLPPVPGGPPLRARARARLPRPGRGGRAIPTAECAALRRPAARERGRRWRSSASARTATWPSSIRRCATSSSRPTCAWWSSTSRAATSRCTTDRSRRSRTCRGRALSLTIPLPAARPARGGDRARTRQAGGDRGRAGRAGHLRLPRLGPEAPPGCTPVPRYRLRRGSGRRRGPI